MASGDRFRFISPWTALRIRWHDTFGVNTNSNDVRRKPVSEILLS